MAKFKIVTYGTSVGREGTIEYDELRKGGFDDFEIVAVQGNDEDFFKEAKDADGICAWIYLGDEEYKRLEKCQVIAVPAIGVDRFDLAAATEHGICIANIPDYCIEEVATHTFALIMDCARRTTLLDRKVRGGYWQAVSPWPMYRMSEKVYGLVSFGHIPQRVAEMIKPMGVKIIAFDPFAPDEVFEKCGVERAETLNDLFAAADYISVHTPHIPATHHMIGKEQFDLLKGDAVFVVTGRGGVVDEDALKEAIESGKVGCAGLDVIEDEVTNESVLKGMDAVVMTPHVAYYSEGASEDLKRKAMRHIINVVREKKAPNNLMNKDVLGKARFEK